MDLYGGINPYESFRFGFGYIDTIRQQRAAANVRRPDASRVDRDQSIYTHQRVMREDASTTSENSANNPMLTTLVSNIADSMNRLFDDSAFKGSPGSFLKEVRGNIRSAVASWLGSQGPQFNTDFGINFDFDKTKEGVFNFGRAEQQLNAALATPEDATMVRNALFGQSSDGLFIRLHASLTASAAGLKSENNATGVYLDISV